MTELGAKDARPHGGEWVRGLLVLLGGFVLSFVFPLAAPVVGTAFIVGGIVTYRRSTDAVVRGIAAAALAGGIVLVLITISNVPVPTLLPSR